MRWDEVRYFDAGEFDSPDAPGSGKKEMNMDFVKKLDRARFNCGGPFVVTSGYRTPEHNQQVGGVDSSSHVRGYAADIRAAGPRRRFNILRALIGVTPDGFNRLGIGEDFIHVDDDPEKDPKVVWLY